MHHLIEGLSTREQIIQTCKPLPIRTDLNDLTNKGWSQTFIKRSMHSQLRHPQLAPGNNLANWNMCALVPSRWQAQFHFYLLQTYIDFHLILTEVGIKLSVTALKKNRGQFSASFHGTFPWADFMLGGKEREERLLDNREALLCQYFHSWSFLNWVKQDMGHFVVMLWIKLAK